MKPSDIVGAAAAVIVAAGLILLGLWTWDLYTEELQRKPVTVVTYDEP